MGKKGTGRLCPSCIAVHKEIYPVLIKWITVMVKEFLGNALNLCKRYETES